MGIQSLGAFGFIPQKFGINFEQGRLSVRIGETRWNEVAGIPSPNLSTQLGQRLAKLRGQLDVLQKTSKGLHLDAGKFLKVGGPAIALSSEDLLITKPGEKTTLTATELLPAPTVLNDAEFAFNGSSTSPVILSGTYDGSFGKFAEFTFRVKNGGELGLDDTEVELFDDQGELLHSFKIDKEAPGEVFATSFGINVSFGPGVLVVDDELSLAVSTSGGVLDPNQAFQSSGLPGGGTYEGDFGVSTSLATIGGTYEGMYDDTLRFEVLRGGIITVDDVVIRVYDGKDNELGTLKFDKEEAPGTIKPLSNGLTLSLSGGVLVTGEEFEVDVVAHDQLTFADGAQVQAGTLTINDQQIVVDALDTLQTLTNKINASGAGVTASFDVATGEFVLTNEEDGAVGIDLGPDDTGFFAAVGLTSAQEDLGSDSEEAEIEDLSEIEQLVGGAFSINGVGIDVDKQNDTMSDVVERINASGAGVVASYEDFRLMIRSSQSFDLEAGSSNFLEVTEVETGAYKATKKVIEMEEQSFADPEQLELDLEEMLKALGATVMEASGSGVSELFDAALRNSFDVVDPGQTDLKAGLGLQIHLGQQGGDLFTLNTKLFQGALSNKAQQVHQFLFGTGGSGGEAGLVARLSDALEQAVQQIGSGDTGGALLDVVA